LDISILRRIIEGGLDKMREAGVTPEGNKMVVIEGRGAEDLLAKGGEALQKITASGRTIRKVVTAATSVTLAASGTKESFRQLASHTVDPKNGSIVLDVDMRQIEKNRIAVIDPFGEVYLCCWKRPYSIGNAMEDDVNALIERSMEDDILTGFRRQGLMSITDDYDEDNPCPKCFKTFE